jgi:hypothetical protein
MGAWGHHLAVLRGVEVLLLIEYCFLLVLRSLLQSSAGAEEQRNTCFGTTAGILVDAAHADAGSASAEHDCKTWCLTRC